jgi:hypothetical protein
VAGVPVPPLCPAALPDILVLPAEAPNKVVEAAAVLLVPKAFKAGALAVALVLLQGAGDPKTGGEKSLAAVLPAAGPLAVPSAKAGTFPIDPAAGALLAGAGVEATAGAPTVSLDDNPPCAPVTPDNAALPNMPELLAPNRLALLPASAAGADPAAD